MTNKLETPEELYRALVTLRAELIDCSLEQLESFQGRTTVLRIALLAAYTERVRQDEWVIVRSASGNVIVLQYKHTQGMQVSRYEQADGTLTDLRGGWDKIKERTEVKIGK